jgi:hypothetical protein
MVPVDLAAGPIRSNLFRNRTMRAVKLGGSRNPLDVAIEPELVEAESALFTGGFTTPSGTEHANLSNGP